MASLTENTGGINQGKPIVRPSGPSEGFLGGLAKAASQGIGAFNQNYQQSQAIEGSKAVNETERSVTNLRIAADQAARAPVEGAPLGDFNNDTTAGYDNLPTDVLMQKQAIDKTRRGIEQGRVATTQLDLQLEQLQQTMESKYPDQAARIGQYMKSQGYDHYMWGATNDAMAADASDKAAANSGRAAVIAKGTEMGLNPNGEYNPDQMFHITSQVLEAQTKAQIMKQSQEAALAAAKESREAKTFADTQAVADQYAYGSSLVSAQLTPIYETFSNLVKSSGTSDDAYSQVEKAAGQVDIFGANLKNHIRSILTQNHASAEVVTRVMADADQQIGAVRDLMSGPASQVSQNRRSVEFLQTNFGLKLDKALPMLKFFKETIGAGFVDAVFGGDPTHMFSPELMNSLKTEMMAYDPTHPNTGFKILQDIGAMAKGNLNLADLPESYVTGDHVKGLVSSAQGAAVRVNSKDASYSDGKEFLNSMGNVVIAANTLQPGNKDLNAQKYAIDSIISQGSLTAFDKLMKDPNHKAQALPTFMATRAGAAQLLEVARTGGPKDVLGQKLIVQNGQYVVKIDPRHTVQDLTPTMDEFGMGNLNAAKFDKQAKSPELQKQADIMNKAVDYLVNTAAADKTTAGIDPTVLRSHYMNGTPLPQKEGEAKTPGWQQLMGQFEQDLDRRGRELDKQFPVRAYNPNRIKYEPLAEQAATAEGIKPQALSWLFSHEGNWDPNIGQTKIDANHDGKPDSSASGPGQVIEGTAKRFGLMGPGFDHRGDFEKVIPAVAKYLAELVKQNGGDYIKALHQYGTLDRRNFSSDAKYQAAVASART